VNASALDASNVFDALTAGPAGGGPVSTSGQGTTAPSSTSTPSSGSPMSAADRVFADLGSLLNYARNGDPSGNSSSGDQVLVSADVAHPLTDRMNVYQSGLPSVAAMWQQADALALKRLNALLSLEDGAMEVPKDTLMRDLLFACLSSLKRV